MFNRPILIYSNYCNYSKLFLQNLIKFPELYNSFIRINIDLDPHTKKRPKTFYEIQEILQFKITNVPTIIVQNGEFVLTGKEAFSWLEYSVNQLYKDQDEEQLEEQIQVQSIEQQPEILEAFNPLEMGSFSDGYAGIDNSMPSLQSFQFLNAPSQYINTPNENGENLKKPNGQLQENTDDYSNYMQKRNSLNNNAQYQSSQQRPMSQLSNNHESMSKKQNEVDKKYEQLLAEREMMTVKKKTPKRVNFANGTFE